MRLKGVIPALVTPLDSDERINVPVLKELIEHFINRGADGFYVAGGTGEGLALRPDERRIIAEESVKAVKGRVPCVIQVASTDFNEACALAKHAESVGADGISATPPLFFGYDEDEVYNYYKKLAECVSIPLIIYYNPDAGFTVNAKFAARMFEVDNITGIKWTSADYYGMMELKQLTHGEMNIINGPDQMFLMGLSAGADGGIGTTYNFLFDLVRGVYDNFVKGDIAKAQEFQNQIVHMITVLRNYKTIPATKALVEAMGFEVGDPTYPMRHYTAEEKKELVQAFISAGLKL